MEDDAQILPATTRISTCPPTFRKLFKARLSLSKNFAGPLGCETGTIRSWPPEYALFSIIFCYPVVVMAIQQDLDNVLVSSDFCTDGPTDFRPLEPGAGPSMLPAAQDVQSLLNVLRSVTESEVTLNSANSSFAQETVDPVNISSRCRPESGDDDQFPLTVHSKPFINIPATTAMTTSSSTCCLV